MKAEIILYIIKLRKQGHIMQGKLASALSIAYSHFRNSPRDANRLNYIKIKKEREDFFLSIAGKSIFKSLVHFERFGNKGGKYLVNLFS